MTSYDATEIDGIAVVVKPPQFSVIIIKGIEDDRLRRDGNPKQLVRCGHSHDYDFFNSCRV